MGSISMFLTEIFIPSDLSKYLCMVKKESERERERGGRENDRRKEDKNQ